MLWFGWVIKGVAVVAAVLIVYGGYKRAKRIMEGCGDPSPEELARYREAIEEEGICGCP